MASRLTSGSACNAASCSAAQRVAASAPSAADVRGRATERRLPSACTRSSRNVAAILGSDPATFDAYDAAIADEFRPVTNALLYRFGRRRFLSRLVDAPRIFHSEHFHTRLDAAARANLRRALDRE